MGLIKIDFVPQQGVVTYFPVQVYKFVDTRDNKRPFEDWGPRRVARISAPDAEATELSRVSEEAEMTNTRYRTTRVRMP